MMKTLSATLILFFSINSFASAKYVGVWCQKFDDFNEYFIFDAKDNVQKMSIGVQAGEIMSRVGYVSKGANGFRIILDKTDIGVVDYKRILFGQQLILMFENGSRQLYNRCQDPRKK
ncbi:hypothetical protein K2X05_12830 [bacterium]|nr:hypothetical protein [bacterium]